MTSNPFFSEYSTTAMALKRVSKMQSITMSWLKTFFKLILDRTMHVKMLPELKEREFQE
jgi:hypothetical protein